MDDWFKEGLAILSHHLVSKVISTGKNKKKTFWITGHLWLLICFSQHWTRGMNFQSKRGSRNRGTSRPKERRDNSSRILTEKPNNTSRWSGSSNISTYCLLCYFIRTFSDIWKKMPAFIVSARQYSIQQVYNVEFTEKVSVLLWSVQQLMLTYYLCAIKCESIHRTNIIFS